MVPRELVSTALGFLHRSVRAGFVGHRPNQLPEDAVPRLRAAIEAALDAAMAAGKDATSPSARFILVTALAEGADRLAATAALARAWQIEAPLPFSITRYAQDFTGGESLSEFEALVRQAAKVIPAPKNDADPEAGYIAAGQAVIRNADFAFIAWNGEEGKGAGGTADVGAQALEAGIPVIWIGVAERQRTKLILPADAVAQKGARAAYLRGALAARFERTERPAALVSAA